MRSFLLTATALVACASLPRAVMAQPSPAMAQPSPYLPPGFVSLSPGGQPVPAPEAASMPAGLVPVMPQGAVASPFAPQPVAYPGPGAGPGMTGLPGAIPGQQMVQAAPGMPSGAPQLALPIQGAAPGSMAGMPPGYPAPPPPPSAQQLEQERAFQSAIMGMQPLNPEQSRQWRHDVDGEQRLIASPGSGINPRPVSGSVTVALKPGQPAPRLQLAPNNTTVLTFFDQTGASWPVNSVTVGNKVFDAQQIKETGGNGLTSMVTITPLANYGTGNMVVTLVKHPVPLVFQLEINTGSVDYRKDIQVQGRGPNAQYDVAQGSSLAPTNDPTMLAFADGIAPKGARKVETHNSDVEAWRYKDLIYVRSQLKMISPAWIDYVKHPSGIAVYTVGDTPVLMFEQDGRTTLVAVDR